MSKQIGNPRVFWIRLEMAGLQKADAAQAQALSILHDAYLAKGVVRADMIPDRELIKLAAQSMIDGLQLLEEEDKSSTAAVRSAALADTASGDDAVRSASLADKTQTCRGCKHAHPLPSREEYSVAVCRIKNTARHPDHTACNKFEQES